MGYRPATNKSVAPIWIWVVASVVSSIILIITFFLSWNQTEDIAAKDTKAFLNRTFNIDRLEAFKVGVQSNLHPKIIVVGTSLTKDAFYKDEDMERFALAHGFKIRFLRFTKNSGKLSDFQGLIELLLKTKPDLICFESALFARDFRQEYDHKLYLKKLLKNSLAKLIFQAKLEQKNDDGNFTDYMDKFIRTQKGLVNYQKTAENFHMHDFSYGNNYKHFFKQAKKQGTKIVFLDLSRSKVAWDMLPPDTENKITNLMQSYQKTYNIQYVSFPYHLSLDYFVDYAHFSMAGRKFYSQWFLKQLPNLLNRYAK